MRTGTTVTLTLAESVGGSLPVVTVAYGVPDSNPLRDADNAMIPGAGVHQPAGDQQHLRGHDAA